MQNSQFLEAPKVLYKVNLNGVTHHILSSIHSSMGFSVLEDSYENIAKTVISSLSTPSSPDGKISKVYFESKPEFMELYVDKTGIDYKIYESCQSINEGMGSEAGVKLDGLESAWEVEGSTTLVAYGGSWAYKALTDRPELVKAILGVPSSIMFFLIMSKMKKSGAGFLTMASVGFSASMLFRAGVDFMNSYLMARHLALTVGRGASIIGYLLKVSYAPFNGVILEEDNVQGISKEEFMLSRVKLADKQRNVQMAKVIEGESEPSLFVYGIYHNVNCDEIPSVLELLKQKGAVITDYSTLEEFKSLVGGISN